jgi:hypothetical protein
MTRNIGSLIDFLLLQKHNIQDEIMLKSFDTLDSPFPGVIIAISQEQFDLDHFCQLVLDQTGVRDEIIRQMCTNPDIMVYYHCFYVVEKACDLNPELFYPDLDIFSALLKHTNSYRRDFGLILIAKLARVDVQDRIKAVLPEYLQLTRDRKFMTARCCLKSCLNIINEKPEFRGEIISTILENDKNNPYSASQKALMRFDVLEIIQVACESNLPDSRMKEYIFDSLKSTSPTTRKKAKELAGSLGLISS